MSVYVTDTHCLLFFVTGATSKLSRRALRTFQRAEQGDAFIYISAVTLWEISRLDRLGVIKLNEGYEDWLSALAAHPCFECVPLDESVIVESRRYSFNRDLFDAAIVATARLKDVPLITRDGDIVASGAVDIWW